MAVATTDVESWRESTLFNDVANEEYKNFIKYIKSVPEALRIHLTSFLYPFYVHISFNFLQKSLIEEGKTFINHYAPLFLNASGYSDVIKTLQAFNHVQEFRSNSYFKQFCEKKFTVKSTEEGIVQIKNFFEEYDCKILLFIFRHLIHVTSNNLLDCGLWYSYTSAGTPGLHLKSPDTDVDKFKDILKLLKGNLSEPVNVAYKILSGRKNLCAADVSFNNSQLVCGFENSEIHLWNLTTDILKVDTVHKDASFFSDTSSELEELLACDISVNKVSKHGCNKVLRGHAGSIFGLLTAYDNLLLSCSEDGTVIAWNTADCQRRAIYAGHNHPVWNIALSPDSEFFATASKHVCMWTFEDHQPLRIYPNQSGDFDCVAFHPNSQYIATASTNKVIQLWTTKDARDVRSFSGHKAFINSIVFSPNGKHLASADSSGCVKIWDLSSCQVLKEFKAHSNQILSMAYNQNATLLATGSSDKILKVWGANFPSANESPENKRSEKHHLQPIRSYLIDSPVHYVNFTDRGLLVSVSSSVNTGFTEKFKTSVSSSLNIDTIKT